MKRLYTIVLLLAVSTFSQAQRQANVWYFGEKFGLNFNTTPPSVLTNGSNKSAPMSNGEGEGSSTICDANGVLLLYSDGMNVFTGAGNPITAVNTNYNISQNLFVPNPANANQYYFIYPWAINATTNDVQGIQFTLFSATTSTNGAVVGTANQTLTALGITQALTAVPDQSNGYWIIAHKTNSNEFVVWHLTNSGFSAPVTYAVGFTAPNSTAVVSMLKTNSCFNQLAVTYFNSGRVQVVDFNNATGQISSLLYDITNFENLQTYGVEFSPNGSILYVSLNGEGTSGAGCRFYQFNLAAGAANINLPGSRYTIDNIGPTGMVSRFGAVQLGPDNNIYMTMHADWGNNGGGVSYIDNPDVFGAGANYQRLALANTNGSIASWPAQGLPPVLRSFLSGSISFGSTLPVVSGALYVCRGTPTIFDLTFNGAIKPNTVTANWNFPAGPIVTVSGIPTSVTHTYTATGTFTAQLAFRDVCDRVYSVSRVVSVYNVANVASGSCSGSTPPITVTLTGANANYLWTMSNGSVLGYGSSLVRTFSSLSAATSFGVIDASTIASNVVLGPTNFGGTGDFDGSSGLVATFRVFSNTILDGISVRKAANFTDGGTNPRPGVISIWQGGTRIASRDVSINTNTSAAVNTVLTNLGFLLTPGLYTISITGYVANYNPTNTSIVNNLNVASVSGATSPFFNFLFRQISPCVSVSTVTGICPLPVTYASFDVTNAESHVELFWQTSKETNNAGFAIEKSTDGVTFREIAFINGKGNSGKLWAYSHKDVQPGFGTIYYRLKQVDYDGNATYSSTLSVQRSVATAFSVSPNPFEDKVNLHVVFGDNEGAAQVKVFGIQGGLVEEFDLFGTQIKEIGQEWKVGVYFVEIKSNALSKTFKLIKN